MGRKCRNFTPIGGEPRRGERYDFSCFFREEAGRDARGLHRGPRPHLVPMTLTTLATIIHFILVVLSRTSLTPRQAQPSQPSVAFLHPPFLRFQQARGYHVRPHRQRCPPPQPSHHLRKGGRPRGHHRGRDQSDGTAHRAEGIHPDLPLVEV